jgi:hypothetical protein
MTKIQEIHELLWNIQKGVSEKREEQEKTLERHTNNNDDIQIIDAIKESLDHTKGQLYEINYILENFWKIISK